MVKKKRVVSCIQPSGDLHLGNYFGAIKNWVRLQEQERYDCIFGIVDMHAMTMPYQPDELRKNTIQMVFDLLAIGIDPNKSTLFIQSLIPGHAKLAWILSCFTAHGELSRMIQFKDHHAKGQFVSAGLFSYPVLQAADILIYLAEEVPIGKDQQQHLELCRNIAIKFNSQFEKFFPEPQPLYTETPKLASLVDPSKKMSKSLGDKHYIGLFEAEDRIRKKISEAVTDSGERGPSDKMSPGVSNLIGILKACDKIQECSDLMKEFKIGKMRYSDLKETTARALIELSATFIARRKELMKDKKSVVNKVLEMSSRASAIADETVKDVKRITGLFTS